MTKYEPHIYKIRTLTNLHVGGSGSNFDIVDKQVQRDPTTEYPSIYASSIKGALRDHFTDVLGEGDKAITYIFGNEPDDRGEAKQGKYRFLSADLLALPNPSNNTPFELAYTDEINKLEEKAQLMGATIKFNKTPSSDFKELTEELPVIARNYLKNGISENLWYEEVVPRESLFVFTLLAPKGDITKFDEQVNGKIIQIGANATIGYGLCLFTKIN